MIYQYLLDLKNIMINYLRNKFCLVNDIKQLELEVHNQQQLINTLQEQLNTCNDVLLNKHIELSNLNKYTSELENKISQIKQLVN